MKDNTMEVEEASYVIRPKWQITAMAIYCKTVAHETTLIVDREWTVTCTYNRRWGPVCRKKITGVGMILALLRIGPHEKQIPSDCPGPNACSFANDYRNKLYQEESDGMP